MTMAHIRAAIEQVADNRGLSRDLIEAIVLVESGGNPYAFRLEPGYPYLMNVKTCQPFRKMTHEEALAKLPPDDFPSLTDSRAHEWVGQQTSWGLMQVMGAVAREHGCRSPYLAELTEPITGLHFGCKHFGSMLAWTKGDIDKALGAYNAGRAGALGSDGKAYAQKVRANLAQIEGTRRA